jgi:hypothetical protein
MNKLSCFLTLIFLSFSQLIFASSQMMVCPSIQKIKTTAFDVALKGDHPGVWTLLQKDKKYNTTIPWTFSLMVEADNAKGAFKKAKKALTTLRKQKGPELVESVWVCDYQVRSALAAVATAAKE